MNKKGNDLLNIMMWLIIIGIVIVGFMFFYQKCSRAGTKLFNDQACLTALGLNPQKAPDLEEFVPKANSVELLKSGDCYCDTKAGFTHYASKDLVIGAKIQDPKQIKAEWDAVVPDVCIDVLYHCDAARLDEDKQCFPMTKGANQEACGTTWTKDLVQAAEAKGTSLQGFPLKYMRTYVGGDFDGQYREFCVIPKTQCMADMEKECNDKLKTKSP